MKTVSFFKNWNKEVTGELIGYCRDLPRMVTGKNFKEAEERARQKWGSFCHAGDCECPKCREK